MKKKGKISHVKRSNQLHTKLSKQGKLKKRRNKKRLPLSKPEVITRQDYSDEEVEDELPSIDKEDLKLLRKAVDKKSYRFLSNVNLECDDPLVKNKKRKTPVVENAAVEEKYEQNNAQPPAKKQKILLPIKTAQGLVTRAEDMDSDSEYEEAAGGEKAEVASPRKDDTLLRQYAATKDVSTAELLARRHMALQNKKFRIGLLSAGLLESPETKVGNFKALLELLEEKDPQLRITVRKIALVSLVEVFKDLLPSYQIRHGDDPNVKLKKDVKQLHDYENQLLKAYKTFLQKIEKMISILRKKKGDMRVFKEAELQLAEMGLLSLCDILKEHSYFNFAKNIIHLLVPYLNSGQESARNVVASCIKSIFKTDTRGEVSLEIVRSINKLVKSKNHNVQPATIEVLLSLKLKDVNLDSEKEEELKKKKMNSKKHNILKLSKRERKREKRLKELNQELLETKADENKKSKMQHLTEITKLVFAMYFKILKVAPSSKLLKAALEGIAKFAHCINVDFYHDLINILDHLIENEALGQKEQLCCVQTVFTILSYQGATINIDPIRFYTHFYSSLLNIDAGKNHADLAMVLSAADSVVIKRRKHLSLQRLLAFTKRLSTLSLQVLPNGALGLLTLVRQVLQLSKASGVLLDADASFGKGVYQPELEEPEYCNAGATALWELLALQRHFHPTVRQYSTYVCSLSDSANETTASGKLFVKKSAQELFVGYDASDVKFVPPVPPPRSVPIRKPTGTATRIKSLYFKSYIKQTLSRK